MVNAGALVISKQMHAVVLQTSGVFFRKHNSLIFFFILFIPTKKYLILFTQAFRGISFIVLNTLYAQYIMLSFFNGMHMFINHEFTVAH